MAKNPRYFDKIENVSPLVYASSWFPDFVSDQNRITVEGAKNPGSGQATKEDKNCY